ncbi:MAG: hypothetical protein NT177_04650 [Chloroflexi bacterium]|nr:hypothetical protein [Chloroflexota bacterium]
MPHARLNTAYMKVQVTFPDEEQSISMEKALAIKKKIEGLLKKEKLELYEVVLETVQKSR